MLENGLREIEDMHRHGKKEIILDRYLHSMNNLKDGIYAREAPD